MAGNLDHPPVWLFPGRRPGTPMHPTHLARRLGKLGVDCLASRNTALLQLAAEIPAAVVADLLGLNASTATKWAQLAGGNWTRYAADRARSPTPTSSQTAMTPTRGAPMTNDPTSISPGDPAAGGHGAFGLWSDLRTWQQRATPDGCPVCQSIRATGQPEDTLLALDASWVTAPTQAPLPGYVCLIARRHVIEPYDLPDTEQQAFFADAMRTARAVAEVVRPVRVNYEIHGNSIPHLHLHIYPRHAGDPFVGGPIDLRRLPFTRNHEQLTALRDAIQAAAPHR